MPFSKKTSLILALAIGLFSFSPRCFADTMTLASAATTPTTIGPSDDSISTDAGYITFDSNGGLVNFQTAEFYLGYSPIPDQIISFSFDDTITLNGITQILTIFGQDDVGAAADTLTIFGGTPILFGDQMFTLQTATVSSANIGTNTPFTLQATVTPVPEPENLLLLATGMLAVLCVARRAGFFLRRTAVPPSLSSAGPCS